MLRGDAAPEFLPAPPGGAVAAPKLGASLELHALRRRKV